MKPGAAVSRSGSAVAFSWEQEPGVSKQQIPVEANNKPPARVVAGSERASASTNNKKKPVTEATVHLHRLRVPPPLGGPGAPTASTPGRSRTRSRGVRPGDDPFLAAYLACTERGSNWGQKLLGWAGLGFGYGLGLSCKSSCEAVQERMVMVRRAKIPPSS